MEVVDSFEEDEFELGISPLGMILVVLSALVGLALFLDPASAVYDIAIGSVIILSIALAFGAGLQRWSNQGNLGRTLRLGLIGSAVVSIIVTITFTVQPQSTVQSDNLLVLGLPAIFETLLFCGGIYLVLLRVIGKWPAVLVQAGLFAIYHFAREPDITYSFVLFAGGIVFMLVFLASRDILAAMLAHALVNLRPLYMTLLLSPLTLVTVGGAFLIYIIWRLRH